MSSIKMNGVGFGSDPLLQKLEAQLSAPERQLFANLDSPFAIQTFLNTIPYSEDKFYRCPLRLLRDRKGHCFDGALFAALALRRLGYPARLLELVPNERDDDHILALFKRNGGWGAIAQSNFTGLRYREPVFRSLRELVMSYFQDFFNSAGEITLRGYRGPIPLKPFDRLDWCCSDVGLEALSDGMDRYRVQRVITDEVAATLSLADERSVRAGLLGAKVEGLFKLEGSSDKE